MKKLEAILSEPIRQHDVIYSYKGDTSIWEGMKPGYVVLRIRRDAKGAILTLKQQQSNELDNIECETRVEDPDAMDKALRIMGYTPEVEVKRTRRKGKLDGEEICLDDVERLGYFLEIERMAPDDADADAVAEDLYRKIGSLGLSRADEEKRGYDTQVFQKRRRGT